jgi:hypothetical protein
VLRRRANRPRQTDHLVGDILGRLNVVLAEQRSAYYCWDVFASSFACARSASSRVRWALASI